MFEIITVDPSSKARRGRLATARGGIDTPCFMPVGTQGSVKSVSPDELRQLGAQIILGNTYHLFVRPGTEVMRHFGGLHKFMAWDRPILTDSGGFQVFSLAKLRKITDEGVHFQNHLDGTPCFLGPHEAMEIQATLGSDIAMAFDECPPYPCTFDYAARSLERTLDWAAKCKVVPTHGLKFGIVQGATFPQLRQYAAEGLVALGFDGYAIGGVSVGEPEIEMMAAVEATEPFLPADRPRYAMGLGTPPQMVEMIARGIDMFDCVLPTRLARNGTAFTASGTINLKNAAYRLDRDPIDEACSCPACRTFTRGYLRHLVKAEEILALRLITLHNLHFYLRLMSMARSSIEHRTFAAFRQEFVSCYRERRSN
ncbi:MAG: tRNA guanosine(34) transglycosylase Tgt [Pseudomonadota bacterium]|nr:tRNA guanosine(34) transglycosylase Tgt [Pseudomonadota bacterium]